MCEICQVKTPTCTFRGCSVDAKCKDGMRALFYTTTGFPQARARLEAEQRDDFPRFRTKTMVLVKSGHGEDSKKKRAEAQHRERAQAKRIQEDYEKHETEDASIGELMTYRRFWKFHSDWDGWTDSKCKRKWATLREEQESDFLDSEGEVQAWCHTRNTRKDAEIHGTKSSLRACHGLGRIASSSRRGPPTDRRPDPRRRSPSCSAERVNASKRRPRERRSRSHVSVGTFSVATGDTVPMAMGSRLSKARRCTSADRDRSQRPRPVSTRVPSPSARRGRPEPSRCSSPRRVAESSRRSSHGRSATPTSRRPRDSPSPSRGAGGHSDVGRSSRDARGQSKEASGSATAPTPTSEPKKRKTGDDELADKATDEEGARKRCRRRKAVLNVQPGDSDNEGLDLSKQQKLWRETLNSKIDEANPLEKQLERYRKKLGDEPACSIPQPIPTMKHDLELHRCEMQAMVLQAQGKLEESADRFKAKVETILADHVGIIKLTQKALRTLEFYQQEKLGITKTDNDHGYYMNRKVKELLVAGGFGANNAKVMTNVIRLHGEFEQAKPSPAAKGSDSTEGAGAVAADAAETQSAPYWPHNVLKNPVDFDRTKLAVFDPSTPLGAAVMKVFTAGCGGWPRRCLPTVTSSCPST
jgi:hypothetical protein